MCQFFCSEMDNCYGSVRSPAASSAVPFATLLSLCSVDLEMDDFYLLWSGKAIKL